MEFIITENSWGVWVFAFVVVLILFTVLEVGRRILSNRLPSGTLVHELIKRTHWIFLGAVAIFLGLFLFPIAGDVKEPILKLAIIIMFFQVGIWVSHLFTRMILQYTSTEDKEGPLTRGAGHIVGVITTAVVWAFVTLLILDNLGFDINALIAGLGISGIAVALAVQNILGDIFASLSIVIDKPFIVGDFIVIDGFAGSVEHIGIKTTRLRSISGEQLIFSNNDLLKSRLRNYKRMRERRVNFPFGVEYETPLEKLEAIPGMVKEIIEAIPGTRFDRVHFKTYGQSSLDFESIFYVLSREMSEYLDIQQKINLELYKRFKEEKINFAYPTQTVYVKNPATPQKK